jgi:hypothetical protein
MKAVADKFWLHYAIADRIVKKNWDMIMHLKPFHAIMTERYHIFHFGRVCQLR